jgi:hypothetical protein
MPIARKLRRSIERLGPYPSLLNRGRTAGDRGAAQGGSNVRSWRRSLDGRRHRHNLRLRD